MVIEDVVVHSPQHSDSSPIPSNAPLTQAPKVTVKDPSASGSAKPLLACRRVAARFNWGDLLSQRLRLYELIIESPQVAIHQTANGQFTLLDDPGSQPSSDQAPPPESPSELSPELPPDAPPEIPPEIPSEGSPEAPMEAPMEAPSQPTMGVTSARVITSTGSQAPPALPTTLMWDVIVDRLTITDAGMTVSRDETGLEPVKIRPVEFEILGVRVENGSVQAKHTSLRVPTARLPYDLLVTTSAQDVVEIAPSDQAPPAHTHQDTHEQAEESTAVDAQDQEPVSTHGFAHGVAVDDLTLSIHSVHWQIPETQADQPSEYAIDQVSLNVGHATLATRSGSESRVVPVSLSFDASQVQSGQQGAFPVKFEAHIDQGVVILDGQVNPSPWSMQGNVQWEDLPLQVGSGVLDAQLSQWVRSCSSSGDLAVSATIEAAAGRVPGLLLAGRVGVHGFDIADHSQQQRFSLNWQELEVAVREAYWPWAPDPDSTRPARLDIERIRLAQPRITYTHPAEDLREWITDLTAGSSEPTGMPMTVSIGSIEVTDGSATITDQTVSPYYQGGVTDLNVAVSDVHWPWSGIGDVRVTGNSLHGGAFELTGSSRAQDVEGRFLFELNDWEITHLNPYATVYGGIRDRTGPHVAHEPADRAYRPRVGQE